MFNSFYCAIAGSRTYNLQTEKSDIDLLFLNSNLITKDYPIVKLSIQDRYNLIECHPTQFLSNLFTTEYWAVWQWLYPYEFKLDNTITEYIKQTRDNIVQNNLKLLYNSLYNQKIKIIIERPETFYKVKVKFFAYAILFANQLYEYAEGNNFISSQCPEGVLHKQLIDLRQDKISYNEAFSLLQYYLQKLEKVKDYYLKSETNEKINQEFSNEILKYNYLDYSEYKKQYS